MRRPPAPAWVSENCGNFSLGVFGGPKYGWKVYLFKISALSKSWLIEKHVSGPFPTEIEAVMSCRDECNRRGLPRLQ